MVIAAPIMPWVGGKEKLLPFILPLLPPGLTQCVDVCGGGGSFTLGLAPDKARLDIYNDLDGDLVNLFRCVRDRPLALIRELGFLPLHARREFEELKRVLSHEPFPIGQPEPWEREELEIAAACFPPEEAGELLDILRGRAELRDVRRAAAFYQVSRGSFSGTRTSFGVKRNNITHFFHLITQAAARLADVVIENKSALELIPERDCPTGLIYADPPYYKAEQFYGAEFTRRDHVRLMHALRVCTGYVIVSYNDCPYIRNLYKDFFILRLCRDHPMSKKKGAEYRELIITNYDPRPYMHRQLDLFGSERQREKWTLELVRIPGKPLKII